MIAQIEGKLISLDQTSALVKLGNLSYEVLLPGYCISFLSGKINQTIILSTMEYYEGTPGGGNLIPRLVGFLTTGEKEFFAKFTSVKGMGIRKGLKSLTIPIPTIAAAIENGDEKLLKTLPGVGKRLAQHIIAELNGKLEAYAAQAQEGELGAVKTVSTASSLSRYQLEALEILVAWGEKRNEAIELVELACERHPDITTAEELVPLAYRMKQGIEA